MMNNKLTFLVLLLTSLSCNARYYRTTAPLTSSSYSSSTAAGSRRRSSSTELSDFFALYDDEDISNQHHNNRKEQQEEQLLVQEVGITRTLMRGSILRIASDLSGGTPLEVLKTRVTLNKMNVCEAFKDVWAQSGITGFWKGTPSRTVEGALMGALFMAGSISTKKWVLNVTGNPTFAALAGGVVGGVAQALVMQPAGLIFTAVNNSDGDVNAVQVIKSVVKDKGILGMYQGMGAMSLRQATNWASRAGFTEIARSAFKMSEYGLLGEIGSGIIGGLGSCWNTPIETIRVNLVADASKGIEPKSFSEYGKIIMEKEGIPGLFRGITPRGIQAIWQTCFMVVVPNILGV